MAGEEGGGGQLGGEVVVGGVQGDGQGLVVRGGNPQLLQGLLARDDVGGTGDAQQFARQRRGDGGIRQPLHGKEEIVRRHGEGVVPRLGLALDGILIPRGIPQRKGVGQTVLRHHPVGGGGDGLAALIQAGETLEEGAQHGDGRVVRRHLGIQRGRLRRDGESESAAFAVFVSAAARGTAHNQAHRQQ